MQTGWKDRLEQWAPEPPAMVWERLSEQLDEKPLFAQKLHDFSAAPPPGAWDTIQQRMEPEMVTTPVVRMLPRNKWIRYGSVAASVLFAFLLFRQYSQPAANGNTTRQSAPIRNTIVSLPGAGKLAAEKADAIIPGKESRATYTLDITQVHYPHVPQLASGPIPHTQAARTAATRLYEVVPATHQIDDGHLERYIVVPVGEDAAVRLPKKLYDLFRCGDVPLPSGCSELMIRLQQRAANPSLVTSADFAGLLEMIRRVE